MYHKLHKVFKKIADEMITSIYQKIENKDKV
jgi:hypothetical protein